MATAITTEDLVVSSNVESSSDDSTFLISILQSNIRINNVDEFIDDIENTATAIQNKEIPLQKKKRIYTKKDPMSKTGTITNIVDKKKKLKKEFEELVNPTTITDPVIVSNNYKVANQKEKYPIIRNHESPFLQVYRDESGQIETMTLLCWCKKPMKQYQNSYGCPNRNSASPCNFSISSMAFDHMIKNNLINVKSCEKGHLPVVLCKDCRTCRITGGNVETQTKGAIIQWCNCQSNKMKAMMTYDPNDPTVMSLIEIKNPETKKTYWQNLPYRAGIFIDLKIKFKKYY